MKSTIRIIMSTLLILLVGCSGGLDSSTAPSANPNNGNGGTNAQTQSCTNPWGGTTAHLGTITAYQNSSVAFGSICISEPRVCTNGVWSGSFSNQNCVVDNPPPPPPGSVTNITLNVSSYASGDGPADLVSNGIPFAPGVLTNESLVKVLDGTREIQIATKILARWHRDNSIRVLLVQFRDNFTTSAKSFNLRIGEARTTQPLPLAEVNYRFPRKIALMNAQYLSNSLIMWQQKPLETNPQNTDDWNWSQKQRENFGSINVEPDSGNICARADQYYDSASTSYQMYVRTGELQYLTNARRWAYHHRTNQIELSGPNVGRGKCGADSVKTRYTFVDALVRDYLFWGDQQSLEVARLVVDNFYMNHSDSNYYFPRYKTVNGQQVVNSDFWTEREAAFAQLGLVAYFEATGLTRYLDRARERFQRLYQMQLENGNRAWVHNLNSHDPSEGCPTPSHPDQFGSSPFMTGLLAESLIRFHQLTKENFARNSILYAASDLKDSTETNEGPDRGLGFIYLGCRSWYNYTNFLNGRISYYYNPDIDNLIVHLYGYAYRISGDTNYLNFGRGVFNYSTSKSYMGRAKQFNQQLRTSGLFRGYIDLTTPNLP